MAQILVPTSDIATGTWAATPLWSKVDDDSTVNPSGDGTVIMSDDNTSPDNADLGLATGVDPAVSTNHILRARWNKNSTGGHAINAVLELWQGTPGTGTLIATLSVTGIGATEVESTYTLTDTEADSITDYSALNLRLIRGGDTGGNPNGRRSLVVDLVELEVPDAVAGAQGQVSWAELEVPDAPREAQVSWVELEVPDASGSQITMVGTPQSGGASNGGDVTLTFDVAPQTDDVVIVLQHQGDSVGSGPTGYTEIARPDSGVNGVSMWYKVMGATPDTDVTILGTGSAQDATSAASYVLRGVDTSSVLDATTVEVGPNTTNDPDPGAITTVTDNAWVIAAVGENGTDAELGSAPTGYSDLVLQATTDTNRANIAMARKEVATAGSEDPGAFTGWSTSEWYAFTVAIRPATTTTDAQGQVSWAELETPNPPRGTQVSWAELEVPTAPRQSQISWAEMEVPTAPRQGQVSWAELEAPTAPRIGQVSWAEFEVPDGPRQAQVSWSEFVVPTSPRQAQISWAEVEVNDAPREGQVSWAELEIPDVPTNDKQGQISWAEFEVPNAPRQGQVSWAEMEAPTPPRQGQVSWAEFEVPTAPRKAAVSWVEMEVPTAPRAGLVSWAEMEAPPSNAQAQVSWAELEVPEVGGPTVNKFLLLGVDLS